MLYAMWITYRYCYITIWYSIFWNFILDGNILHTICCVLHIFWYSTFCSIYLMFIGTICICIYTFLNISESTVLLDTLNDFTLCDIVLHFDIILHCVTRFLRLLHILHISFTHSSLWPNIIPHYIMLHDIVLYYIKSYYITVYHMISYCVIL